MIGKEISPGIFSPPFSQYFVNSDKVRVGKQRKGAFSTQMTVERNVGENAVKVSRCLKEIGPRTKSKAPFFYLSVFQGDAVMVKISHSHQHTVGRNVTKTSSVPITSHYWGHWLSLDAR